MFTGKYEMVYISDSQKIIVENLLKNKALKHIVTYVNSKCLDSLKKQKKNLNILTAAFAMSAPKLYKHYKQLANNITTHHPEVHCSLDIVFMATIINLETKCLPQNIESLPNDLYAFVSMRNYNYKLHELKLKDKVSPWLCCFVALCQHYTRKHKNI